MSNEVQPPAVKPVEGKSKTVNGRSRRRPKLVPLSPMDTIVAVVQRTEDKLVRSMKDNETGLERPLPPESYVYAAGFKLIVPGGTAKKEGKLPLEGEFVMLQVRWVKNTFGTKPFLEKWRPIKDILSVDDDSHSLRSALVFPDQLVSSDTEGYDFNVMEPEPVKKVEEA